MLVHLTVRKRRKQVHPLWVSYFREFPRLHTNCFVYVLLSSLDAVRMPSRKVKMNTGRRRANNFTDSLTSFRHTISDEEPSTSQVPSEDRLNFGSEQCRGDKPSSSKNNKSRADSIILAGHLASQKYISLSDNNISCNTVERNYNMAYSNRLPLLKDTSSLSDKTSYLSIKPDLNKCINLFHNEHLNKEYGSLEEQLSFITLSETTVSEDINPSHLSKNKTMEQWNLINNRLRSVSENSLKDAVLVHQEVRKSKSHTMLDRDLKRDTNYNIKADQLFCPTKPAMKIDCHNGVETTVSSFDELSLSKPSALSSRKDDSLDEDQRRDSTNNEKSSKEELNPSELRTFLYSLVSDQNPLKDAEDATTERMQKRFLRRLSTNYYDSPKAFTEELLTIIEESIINNDSYAALPYPEISIYRFNEEVRKMCKFIDDETILEWPQSPGMSTPICVRRKSQETESDLLRKPNKDLPVTSISVRRNIKSPKRICRRISKNTSYTAKNLPHDSTSTFECLEAYCEKLYRDDYKTVSAREKNQLQSPLRSMDSILHTCNSQMASLDDSGAGFNFQERIKKAGTRTSNGKPHEMIDLDDLENTLMYEIAKKRHRCLDTAKLMMEINANSELTETQETYPNIVIDKSFPTKNDDEFMKTLMSVQLYQDFLEKYKSLLNLVHRSRSSNPRTPRDGKDVRTKKMSNGDFNTRALPILLGDKPTLQMPKPKKKSTSPSPAKRRSINKFAPKPRLFVTPGKTPVKKSCKPKCAYFPNMMPETNKQNGPNINPHAKKIYRQIGSYDHVSSPVGAYIKGTDPHLLKNLRPKTDEMLLTPRKKQTTRSRSPKMKFRLSPKQPREEPAGTAAGDDNVANNFPHPKVHYKQSSHIRTIKETENQKGNRINELLRSTKDKVVIRHEGRTKSVQTNHLEQPEIYYDSAEESVHIEQTARKTCSHVQKNH